jgi:mannosyl-oligosaccharide glucosidase
VPKEKLREYEYASQSLENYDDLKRLHWYSKQRVFADYGNDTPDVVLEEYQDRNQAMEWRRIINGSYPTPGFVNHIGYVTMFPFALGLIPENAAEMHDYLDMLKKPEHLWSPFGLRSLSKSSSIYNRRNTPHDPPYWRGAIWINMNYLVVRAMRQYSKGQHRDVAQRANVLARELSCNVVNTIVREYEKHGFVYENYDDQSGKGKGCHPFTGWTALVAMLYDPTCTRQT